jgi:hypothetical protein
MAERKIDHVKLSQLVRTGKSVKECAKFFNVTPSAICQAKDTLNINVVKNIALENAHRLVDKNLNTLDQLNKINEKANALLDEIEDNPAMALKAMAEIRAQLKLQLEIFQALYDMKSVEEFQSEVLTIISEIDKGVRDRIIQNLAKKRAVRSAVKLS